MKKILFGNIRLHTKQAEAIQSLKDGKNTLLIMGTGRGKSAVFQLHSALKATCEDKITIILYPLRSLIRDQYLYLEQVMAKIGIKAIKLTGESSIIERENSFEELKNGLCHIVLTTPEFLFHNVSKFQNIKQRIGFFVADEAHHLQTSSFHYRPIYRTIHKVLPKIGSPVVLAATATANDETTAEIIKQLNIKNVIIDKKVRENLFLEDMRETVNKEKEILKIILNNKKTVIYTNSREKCTKLAQVLRKRLPGNEEKIVFYHAGLNAEDRKLVQDGFKNGIFTTIVATSAFGEGINITNIENLILYHLPFSFVQYNQQCGRAGRNNKPATIYLLYGQKDAGINDFILENICPRRETLRNIYLIIKNMSKGKSFIGDNFNILAEYEANGFKGLTEKGIASSLKLFAELGLIEVRREEDGRVIELVGNKKVDLATSIFYKEAQNEKEIFKEFKEVALKADVNILLRLFNQPIFPKDKVLEPV